MRPRWGMDYFAGFALAWSPATTTDNFAGSMALRKAAFSWGKVTAIKRFSKSADHS